MAGINRSENMAPLEAAGLRVKDVLDFVDASADLNEESPRGV